MNKQSVITILFVLVSITGRAQTMVWDEVVTGYVNQSNISVTKVALNDNRTELTLHVGLVKGRGLPSPLILCSKPMERTLPYNQQLC